MSRVPGTFRNLGVRVAFGSNPEWTDDRLEMARRGDLKPACHDKTPYADVYCPTCGYKQHVHLSQFESLPSEVTEMASICPRCEIRIIFDRAEAERGFREAWGYAPAEGH